MEEEASVEAEAASEGRSWGISFILTFYTGANFVHYFAATEAAEAEVVEAAVEVVAVVEVEVVAVEEALVEGM